MCEDISDILLEYASDTERTFTANNFVRWVYQMHPDVAERVGPDTLEAYAQKYMWSGNGRPPWSAQGVSDG